MSTELPNPCGHKPCKHLRSREMFYDTSNDGAVDDYASGIFWCANTETCLGPDGTPADDESCGKDRACHEL